MGAWPLPASPSIIWHECCPAEPLFPSWTKLEMQGLNEPKAAFCVQKGRASHMWSQQKNPSLQASEGASPSFLPLHTPPPPPPHEMVLTALEGEAGLGK